MANIDLDILMPESDIISFTGSDDGVKYEIDLFIPSVYFTIMSNKDMSDIDRQTKILEAFLKRKYKHMTIEWIDKNISAPRQNAIMGKILDQIEKEKGLAGNEE